MRELDLLNDYLVKLRQERLQRGHAKALDANATLEDVRICAHEAELVMRIQQAVQVLARDPGKFIQEFLS